MIIKKMRHPLTMLVNQKQKNQSKLMRNQALTWLAQQFPLAFDNTHRIRPLKIGIINDILMNRELASQHGISISKLREAVALYTRRIDYLTCLKAQETRIDLQGNPTAAVSKEEAALASKKIKRAIEIKMQKTQNESKIPGSKSMIRDFATKEATPSLTARPEIQVTHKTKKTFDPQAIERLKNKLGLMAN